MTNTELRELNQKFADAFGRNDQGEAKYQWQRTSDIHYFVREKSRERTTPAGLVVLEPHHSKHPYSNIYGACWIIVAWKPPMSEDMWLSQFGTQFPYPKNGKFSPIDNTNLPEGVEPDEHLTAAAIHCIRTQIETPIPQIYDGLKEAGEKQEAKQKADFADMVDSDWFAFDGVPGMKLNTSFPTPEKYIIHPNAE